MLAAHMDEIGLVATYIDDKGFIRYSIFYVSPFFSVGQRVRFQNGVTGCVYYEEKLQGLRTLNTTVCILILEQKRKRNGKAYIPGDIAVFVENG